VVEMELHRILISETSDQQYIFLKEKDGERTIPIVIGFYEAQAIDRFVKEEALPRPMTHDLFSHVIEALGARVEKIEVTNLKDSTFFAVVHLVTSDDRRVEIDARPSDAIALALRAGAPIFVTHEVLTRSRGIEIEEDLGEADQWRQWINHITPGDFARNPPGGAAPGTDDRERTDRAD